MSPLSDFRNLKTKFSYKENTTSVVDLIIPSTVLRAKYNIHNPIIKKAYKVQGGLGYFSNYRNMFQNEVKYLKIVSGLPHFPKLIFIDDETCSIYMEYSGGTILNDIAPLDWKKQLIEIVDTLKRLGISHNDFYAVTQNSGSIAQAGDTDAGVPIVDKLTFGDYNQTDSQKLCGHIRKIVYYPEALTNAELIALTENN